MPQHGPAASAVDSRHFRPLGRDAREAREEYQNDIARLPPGIDQRQHRHDNRLATSPVRRGQVGSRGNS